MSNVLNMRGGKKTEKGDEKALSRLQNLVADDMNRVNSTILEMMQSPVALIPELAGHLIASGGKRLRPLLTLASAKMVGYEGKRHYQLAACVEFIHTATLLHDDVVDESELRRGKESAHTIWGKKPSVLVGDFLFSKAFELMVDDGSLKILKILSHASSVIAEGEVMQLVTSNDTETTEEAYLEVIYGKTAELFAAACEVGAVVAERPAKEEKALRSYGRNLGVAFQLVDDALDYSAKQAVLGKNVGDDFRGGKITLPIILAFARGDANERTFWKKVLEENLQGEDDLNQAMAYLTKHNAIEDTIKRARHYGDIAKDALGIFPDGEARSTLLDIVDFAIKRAY